MTSKALCLIPAISFIVAAPHRSETVFAEGLPAAATLLDDKIIMYLRPVPLVSPNGRYVAYVSRGFVCVADVESATSRRLIELPNTWTHIFASVGETAAGGSPDSLVRALGGDKCKELQDKITDQIGDLQWTVDSSAIVFGVSSYDVAKHTTQVHIWRAPLVGEPKELASNKHSLTTRRGPGGRITLDGRFLVANSARERALIWDLAKNMPRATPFLYLTPSQTSGRWLGVEKDTRQLVVVDDDFNVIIRHEEILPENEFGFDMCWSPDERFIFWRQQIGFDYYSNWVGCRYDLETRERQVFTGDYMAEQIQFTGNRGEFLRVGASGVQRNWSGLNLVEHYVGLVPDGRYYMQRFWYSRADPPGVSSKVRMLARLPNISWSPNFQLFTIGLPRQEGPYGEVLHLADRQRHLWKLPGGDSGQYISPYNVAGFALDGNSIIAYDDTRLIALPVAAIQTPENKIR